MKRRPPHTPAPRPAAAPKATHWGEVAEWYDQLVGEAGSEYHQHVVIPGVLRMLSVKPGQSLLDVACGQGVLCRTLAKEGAHVTGLDAAASLIEAAVARSRDAVPPIAYRVADATKLPELIGIPAPRNVPPLNAASFDAATCILAIQNITPLSPVWQGIRTLLKPGGMLVVVMMHPCFRVPKQSGWGWDDQAHAQYRRVDRYLSSDKVPIQMHPGAAPSEQTLTFHRPLQAYVNTLGSAGLLIDRIEEWASHKTSQAGPKKAALDRSRKEIPLFLALRARAV